MEQQRKITYISYFPHNMVYNHDVKDRSGTSFRQYWLDQRKLLSVRPYPKPIN